MRSKKGQAAMEFIMTYGWAVLVVLVVIGALVYFGVLSPERLLPERCTFPAELGCVGKPRVDPTVGNITISLINNVGYPIVLTNSVTTDATGSCQSPTMYSIAGIAVNGAISNVTLSNGQQAQVIIGCSSITAGRFKTDITLQYVNQQNSVLYPVTGEIRANAQ